MIRDFRRYENVSADKEGEVGELASITYKPNENKQ